jgi:hypothetical protein
MTAAAMPVVGRDRHATVPPAGRRLAGADIELDPPLRDELRLVLSIAFAVVVVFVPAVALVAGAGPLELLAWASIHALCWISSVTLQVAVLRVARAAWRGRGRSRLALQFAVTAVAGTTLQVAAAHAFLDPWSRRLGLLSGGVSSMASVWTAVLIAAYLVWERELRARQRNADRRLAAVQRAQLAARRSLVDSQLRAVQARVDPAFFFATLDAIEALYPSDAARAEAAFEELVGFLRAALPTVDGQSTVLARELELAAACVRIHALTGQDDCTLRIDLGETRGRRPFPAGVLLPLVRGALDAATGPIELLLSVRDGEPGCDPAFTLTLRAPAAPNDDVCTGVRASLRALFGTSAKLVCTPDAAGVEIALALPLTQ